MHKCVFLCLLANLLAAGIAFADEEYIILKVAKPVRVEVLRDAGLLYLTDLGDSYLVYGDLPAVQKATAARQNLVRLGVVYPGEERFPLHPKITALPLRHVHALVLERG